MALPRFQLLGQCVEYCCLLSLFGGPADEMNEFVPLLNSSDSNSKFSLEHCKNKVHFLDMWLIQNSDSLITALYQRKKDWWKHSVVSYQFPLKRGLPKSQVERLRGSCHFADDFKMTAEGMKTRFQQIGYPDTWVSDANEEDLKRKTRFEWLK